MNFLELRELVLESLRVLDGLFLMALQFGEEYFEGYGDMVGVVDLAHGAEQAPLAAVLLHAYIVQYFAFVIFALSAREVLYPELR